MTMATVKVSDLTGASLDWAAAKCDGFGTFWYRGKLYFDGSDIEASYSVDWSQGGQIIEREKIGVGHSWEGEYWLASANNIEAPVYYGPTPLIAAMRCYVASELGDTIEVPSELIK